MHEQRATTLSLPVISAFELVISRRKASYHVNVLKISVPVCKKLNNINHTHWQKKIIRKESVKSLPRHFWHSEHNSTFLFSYSFAVNSCDPGCSYLTVIEMMYATCIFQLERLKSKYASLYKLSQSATVPD